jgi:hypothetical protein
MRAHIDPGAGRKLCRADVIEEDERADQVAARGRQHPPHFEAAQVARPGLDDSFDADSHVFLLRLRAAIP